jgi:hypothetical protein
MRIFVLKNCCNRDLLCWRFPPRRGKSTLFPINKGIILVLWFHIICCSTVISVIFSYSVAISVLFSALFLFSANIIDLVPYKWYQSTFLDRKLWVNFFRVETYSDILKLQRSIVTHINPWSRE